MYYIGHYCRNDLFNLSVADWWGNFCYSRESLKMADASISSHGFVPPQMVRGVRAQTDLEEEGASRQVLARHALSRWSQTWRWAWRWARGERTTVAPDLNHHQETKLSWTFHVWTELIRSCRDNLCRLGGAWCVCHCCFFFVIWTAAFYLDDEELRPLPWCFTLKDDAVASLYQYQFLSYLWIAPASFKSVSVF